MSFAANNQNSAEQLSDDSEIDAQEQSVDVEVVKLSKDEIDKLIVDHREHGKRLAWSFLTSWRMRLAQDDVISVVGAALCEAATRFDPTKGTSFKTFFFYHLRGMLLKEISRMIEEQKVLQFVPNGVVSEQGALDSQPGNGWVLPLVENNNPERIIERRQIASACWEACAELDELEQEVLIRFFVYDQPLAEIARELNYCRCHISRVKSRSLAKVGKLIREHKFFEAIGRPSEEVGDGDAEELCLPTLTTGRAKRRSRAAAKTVNTSYTGGRGRRKQHERPKKSKALQRLLDEAY